VDSDPHGSASFWEPCSRYGSAPNKNQDPDPHQCDKLDPDPHQFVDDKTKCRYRIGAFNWKLGSGCVSGSASV
jgi:hypothetical protein